MQNHVLLRFQDAVELRLTVLKGYQAIYVSHSGARQALSSTGSGDNELIIPRGTRFKITSVEARSMFADGRSQSPWLVHAEVLPK